MEHKKKMIQKFKEEPNPKKLKKSNEGSIQCGKVKWIKSFHLVKIIIKYCFKVEVGKRLDLLYSQSGQCTAKTWIKLTFH